jgi:hypothetical protein
MRKGKGLRGAWLATGPTLNERVPPECATKAAMARKPANDDRKARIVTTRPRRGREVEDLTPEEHRQRGDAADALFRELVRRATSKS